MIGSSEWIRFVRLIFLVVTSLASLFQGGEVQATSRRLINGAGATFPYPIYNKWFSEFRRVDPTVSINYQSIGSGGGIRQLLDRTVDFGASDAPMTDSEMKKADSPVLHIPTVLGAVVISYNLPGVKKTLRLTPEVLTSIYLGEITKWSDPSIAKLNPDIDFPQSLYIMVVHRSDGSGTTAVFTDYLSKVSPVWKQSVGAGKAVRWPTGIGGKGNEGVSGMIKQSRGAIGYIERAYAETNHLPLAQIKNQSGQYVGPTTRSVTAAASGALGRMPTDFRISITNAEGKDAYPIAAFTYLLIYRSMEKEKGKKMVSFLNWALSDGQKMVEDLYYSPLPKTLAEKVQRAVDSIKLEGKAAR